MKTKRRPRIEIQKGKSSAADVLKATQGNTVNKRLFILAFTLLWAVSVFARDLAWIDVDHPGAQTASFYSSLVAAENESVTTAGVTFTIFGAIDSRSRALDNAALRDFAFRDGQGAYIGLRIENLAAGTYDVHSWHFDGAGFAGMIEVEFREICKSGTLLVNEWSFSTMAASYQITSNGETTYELVFREDSSDNRTRLNALKIRETHSTPSVPVFLVDAGESNTMAEGATPNPFWEYGVTTDDRWYRRPGVGFDILGNREVFEKEPSGGGNAAPLVTTASGLFPGRKYGVYVLFLSVPGEAWRVRAGLSDAALTEFQPGSPPERTLDHGLSRESASNRHQYLGFVGNATADVEGNIVVHIDDGEVTGEGHGTSYEGLMIGDPREISVPVQVPDGVVEIAPDGAWTWFNDERAIWHGGFLFSGYVTKDGRYGMTRYDPATNSSGHSVISTDASRQMDDHNNPSITVLPDGKLLICYSPHNSDGIFYFRKSRVMFPVMEADWGDEQTHSFSHRNTYNNTYYLSKEPTRIFNFHRCINLNPTLTLSNDLGTTWETPLHFIKTGTGNTLPYPRYCANHFDRIDLIYTDGHPRNDNNSIYHLFYRNGSFFRTDGTAVKNLSALPLDHDNGERGSIVYSYASDVWKLGEGPDDYIPTGRAWTWDICYGVDGHPVCVFQVQRDEVAGCAWSYDRVYYYYSCWTGNEWKKKFIAQGGRGLYPNEDDYAGGMCLDPDNPNVVYISSNHSDPFDLNYDGNGVRNTALNPDERYEIYRGETTDRGKTFTWEAITSNSARDNLRPFVPENHGFDRHVIWIEGEYKSYRTFDTRVLGLFDNELRIHEVTVKGGGVNLVWDSAPGREYGILGSDNLLHGFADSATRIPSQGHRTSYKLFIPNILKASPCVFLKIQEY
jgi:hypothetical protein